MEPHLIHLTKDDYVVSQWSGGTTTQLAIAPSGAQYGDRAFLWRLSSATVDLEAKTAHVTLSAPVSDDTLKSAVTDAGYQVVSMQ